MTEPTADKETVIENNMHDKCKNVVVFHNNLTKFFMALKGVLPEYVKTIRESIKYYKSVSRAEYLEEVENLLKPHIKYISEYDEGIFTDDYKKGPRYLLPKMDFREIWNLLDNDDFQEDLDFQTKTKKTIFNHMQSIYVSVQMALNQINLFNRNMEKQKSFLMNMMENLQMDDKIKARIEEMKKEEEEAAKSGKKGSGLAGMGQLADMFGEDNFVYQLAKDVADELDLGTDNIDNPVEAITQLFADNGRKIQELIITVGDKIEQKVESGEIDKDRLIKDAKSMKDKMEGIMGKIPGLEDMVNDNAIAKQFKDMYNDLPKEQQQEFKQVPKILDKIPTDWTDEEREQFDTFAKHVVPSNEGHAEHEMDIDQSVSTSKSKPKPKKVKKSKSSKPSKPSKHRKPKK